MIICFLKFSWRQRVTVWRLVVVLGLAEIERDWRGPTQNSAHIQSSSGFQGEPSAQNGDQPVVGDGHQFGDFGDGPYLQGHNL